MQIKTNGHLLDLTFGTLVAVKKENWQKKVVRDDSGNESDKLTRDGRVQYRTQLTALRYDENGDEIGVQNDIGLAVLEPTDLKRGVDYVLDGDVWVTPWSMNGGRIQYSIIAERIKPKTAPSVVTPAQPSHKEN